MNACEKMQIAKMNLRPGRGRSIEALTRMALETLRKERKECVVNFIVETDSDDEYLFWGRFESLRQARIWQIRTKILFGVEAQIVDLKTGICVA